MREKGLRVGALMGSDPSTKVVDFLGYGTYVGEHVPDGDAVGGLADRARAMLDPNPKIQLDSGKVVWGCECWWAPEDEMKRKMAAYIKAGYAIRTVDIDDARRIASKDNN